ncbi:MAG: cysteine--tRNA ligase [Elusimicrobiota bacterium]
MSIRLYNTLTGKKEEFIPLAAKEVRMYVCGITPYDSCHLGHARCYVVFDCLRRFFSWSGYQVNYVQNFTDIDDKIIKRAAELKTSPGDLARKYIAEYYIMMDQLNIQRASVYPLVTEHIGEIIDFVQVLLNKGFAYVSEGNVFFSVRKFSGYGRLSKRGLEELLAGARVEVDPRKKDPLDFALWKSVSPEEEICWDSPWGRGRPGWHIECSTMSKKYLGESFDLHGGGADLIFPHHENEIAQSEGFSGKPMVRCWLHNGFVTIKEDKMSKSLGNFFTVAQIFQQASPMAVRFFLLNQHYRSPLDFSLERLEEAKQGWQRITGAEEKAVFLLDKLDEQKQVLPVLDEKTEKIKNNFRLAMEDDFNTALAIGEIFNLAGMLNKYSALGADSLNKIKGALTVLKEFKSILGLELSAENKETEKNKIEELIKKREEARMKKDWASADQLRRELEKLEIVLEDTPHGTRWRKK